MKMMQLFLMLLIGAVGIQAQTFECKNWNDSPQKGDGEAAHSIYRSALKSNDWQVAIENWQIAYDIAPAADGKRDFHFTDGIKIYEHLLKEATDDTKKEEYKAEILRLYSECMVCYEQHAIVMSDCDDDCYNSKVGFLAGRMGYDMFYNLNSPYSQNLEALLTSVKYNGNTTEYIVLEPLATIAVYQFQKDLMTADEARAIYDQINAIADYNIENDDKYAEYYASAQARANAVFKTIENQIFDCAYFKAKLLPRYEANPTDFEVLKYVYNKLKQQGCDDSDADLVKIKSDYESLASKYNSEMRAEWLKKNPNVAAKQAYDNGNYDQAVSLYQQALNTATDDKSKADYYFRIASIYGRKLKRYSEARKYALDAAKLRSNWGAPYMLIGDLYAISSRSCGDAWNQRLVVLAAIDKYAKAKSIDPSVATSASSRIAKYNSSKPDPEQAFMQGLKEGQTVKTGCWVGESVRLRFK